MNDDELKTIITTLQRGDYDETDIITAWLALEQYQDLRADLNVLFGGDDESIH
tara:strand:- start:319 stop:477 length:159 start_codon:yes stop_codon:yes gene_type:complete